MRVSAELAERQRGMGIQRRRKEGLGPCLGERKMCSTALFTHPRAPHQSRPHSPSPFRSHSPAPVRYSSAPSLRLDHCGMRSSDHLPAMDSGPLAEACSARRLRGRFVVGWLSGLWWLWGRVRNQGRESRRRRLFEVREHQVKVRRGSEGRGSWSKGVGDTLATAAD